MQIHEIFRRRADEGILGGIATDLANKTLVAASPAGIDLKKAAADGVGKVGSGAAQAAATKLNQPLIKQMAEQAQENWLKTVSFLMTQKGTNNIDELAPVAETELKRYINTKMLPRNSMISGNYENIIARMKNAGPLQLQYANDRVNEINDDIKKILTNGMKQKDLAAVWLNISTNIFIIINLSQFHGENNTSRFQSGGNPAAAQTLMTQAAQEAGLTAKELGIPLGTVKSTGNAQADALLKAMGLI